MTIYQSKRRHALQGMNNQEHISDNLKPRTVCYFRAVNIADSEGPRMWPRLKIENYKGSVSGEVTQKHEKKILRLNRDGSCSDRFIPGQKCQVS
jgi:hypothetical protein